MRWILPAGGLLVLIVIMCGCIQSPSAPAGTPAPTGSIPDIIQTEPTTTRHLPMAVDITAEKTANSVVIRVDGGNDAGTLTSLKIHIKNYDGTTIQRTIPSPEIGRQYAIQYFREATAANVNIIGTFSDGYQQTLLITAV